MTIRKDYTVKDVQGMYDGPGGIFWEMITGDHLHPGGEEATVTLAEKVGLNPGMRLLDICCAVGGPARYIAQKYDVQVVGIDITKTMYEEAIKRTKEAGLEDKIEYTLGNALDIPYNKEEFDIAWSQDAWAHINDKDRLIREAWRILKDDGIIAVTDWVITGKISDDELGPLYDTMNIPYMETFEGYHELLLNNSFEVLIAEDRTEWLAEWFHKMHKLVHGEMKPKLIGTFNQEFFEHASNMVTVWMEAAKEHKVGIGLYIGKK